MDVFSQAKRSLIMSKVRGKNTKPELVVRSLLHRMGYRFRLHRRDLPGNPDIVLPRHKKVIFVHGCFWHGHKDCLRAKRPTTNEAFWNEKLSKNIERDKRYRKELETLGWSVLLVWSCRIKDPEALREELESFMNQRQVDHD